MDKSSLRRTELPTPERRHIALIDNDLHSATRTLNSLSKAATLLYNESELYSEPTYLDEYVRQLTPAHKSDTEAVLHFSNSVEEAGLDYMDAVLARQDILDTLPQTLKGMFEPVRDFSDVRIVKQGNVPGAPNYNPSLPTVGDYREVKIEPSDEAMVSLKDYGVKSHSYYARPNALSGAPVPGLKSEVFVRESIAERLVKLNELLKLPEVTAFFGEEVELFVDEGYRDPAIQRYLYEDGGPKKITADLAKAQGINLDTATDDQLAALHAEMLTIRQKKIGKPVDFGESTPAPHQTGSAVDVAIRYKQDTDEFVPKINVWFGKAPANLINVTNPDHFEHTMPTTIEELVAQQNLRAWHYLLGAVGLTQNATEFWHAGNGDQLSAITEGDIDTVVARFGWPTENPNTYTAP